MATSDDEGESKATGDREWPNLFQESITCTLQCIAVFGFSSMRKVARSGGLENGDVLLDLPLRSSKLMEMIDRNEESLRGKIKGNELDTLLYLVKVCKEKPLTAQRLAVEETEYQVFGDDKETEECVYAISTNSSYKRIILSFRGSITPKDWIQDSKVVFADMVNPLSADRPDQPKFLKVHKGFRDYLYFDAPSFFAAEVEEVEGKLGLGSEIEEEVSGIKEKLGLPFVSNASDAKPNKISVILDQVQSLMDLHPDYTLYVTGHSLGGSLALIAALEAAAKFGEPNRPVTCFPVGNPKAGDSVFRDAVNTLEREKRLRVCCVHNQLDLVPLLPDSLFTCYVLSCNYRNFCHAGMQVTLKDDSLEHFYHGPHEDTKCNLMRQQFKHWALILPGCYRTAARHFYREYLDRLLRHKDQLSKLSLNGLYGEKSDIVW